MRISLVGCVKGKAVTPRPTLLRGPGLLVARDNASLDVFWLRDESLEDTDKLPSPGMITAEIVEDLEAALAEFADLAESLQGIGINAAEET